MGKEKNWIFKDECLLNWPLYQEVNKGFQQSSAKFLIWDILIVCTYIALLVATLQAPYISYGVLIGLTLGCILQFLRKRITKDGDRHYIKLVQNNGGNPPYKIHTYYGDEVISTDQDTKIQTGFSYSQIQKIIETNRIFILITDTKECIIADMRWLSGGDREEFRSFLVSRCINVRHGIQKGVFSKVLQIVARVLALALFVISLAFLYLDNRPAQPGTLGSDLNYREIAAELSDLGITCSEEMILEIEEVEASIGNLTYDYLLSESSAQSRTMSLLSWAGYGSYDAETYEWTPSSNGVFWIDMEAFRISTMYTDYLRGIEALSNGELVFTDVQEVYDNVDWESGTGFGQLSFSIGGKTHKTVLKMDADWYDAAILKKIGSIVNTQDTGKKLYYLSDGGQGFLIFYCDAQWTKDFTALTGFQLSDSITDAQYLAGY